MKYVTGFVIACIMWAVVLFNVDMPEYKVYDCGIAEFHPDITNTVKEECRKRKYQDRKRKNENTI